jgi:hypothetical protein
MAQIPQFSQEIYVRTNAHCPCAEGKGNTWYSTKEEEVISFPRKRLLLKVNTYPTQEINSCHIMNIPVKIRGHLLQRKILNILMVRINFQNIKSILSPLLDMLYISKPRLVSILEE